jgi:hypothetical protein
MPKLPAAIRHGHRLPEAADRPQPVLLRPSEVRKARMRRATEMLTWIADDWGTRATKAVGLAFR